MRSPQQHNSTACKGYSGWFVLIVAVFITCLITANITAVKLLGLVLLLIQTAIESKKRRLQLALELAKKRLVRFEQKYGTSSERFVAEMTAEDLEGGDDEYVRWAGEYQLMQRLQEKMLQVNPSSDVCSR